MGRNVIVEQWSGKEEGVEEMERGGKSVMHFVEHD